ncbi:metalloregulator ArsR/SmtB family transcription factor [Geomonas oryzisoli]|uniref:Metalloregulator ArsR/SmtB family transcription factor n=1 Tax=Geomonas oryzisoli TaxID=2847992 RepID=A0ABX8JA31_9BACT|nr:metalloregulator ArsR/SmtB family transcription factor [Geomonas oryzisoli]QWV92400.1 metalloregulator ArsR/SmtB family transcription factor [Geomonas oryzisoli]
MENIALLFQSLDDQTRLRLLALLLQAEELCVCDLVAVLKLPQSTVSRQLAILKSAGWVKGRRGGAWNHYSINASLEPVQQFLVPVLRNFLLVTDTAREDLRRLRERRGLACCPEAVKSKKSDLEGRDPGEGEP